MGMFDFKGQFPTSALIDAAIQKRKTEEEARRQRQEQLLTTIQGAGQTATNLVKQKQDMAQALALSNDPDAQNYLTGRDRQVATVGGRPVTLGDTASSTGNILKPNAPLAPANKFLPFVQSGKGYDLMKEAKDMAYKKSTVQDYLPQVDAQGKVIGYQTVTRNRGGRTLAPTRPTPPRATGGGSKSPSEEALRNTAFDNAIQRIKQQFPFGKQQAEAQGVDYDAQLESMAGQEYDRLKSGTPKPDKSAERQKFIQGAMQKGYTQQEAEQLAGKRGL